MGESIRERIERSESERLSAFAALASESQGRERAEAHDPIRTCFQRDRDRILHCKSFRRLKHKTQVFIDPRGDHFRTRLTHSLEVAQIARTIGRALQLNEDLIEAIALGHDVGHTPFGHAGERALDEAIRAVEPGHTGFRHYEQSLRVVDVLENLNLTQETRQGIGGHSKGRKDLTAFDGEPTSTLEAAVVRISDRIAYMNHDLDDALRSGLVASLPSLATDIGETHGRRIGAMVMDVIENSVGQPSIILSAEMQERLNALKEWLFEYVYLQYPMAYPDIEKAEGIVRELFAHYRLEFTNERREGATQLAIDYVAGMTDRFAVQDYAQIKLPQSFVSGS